MEGAGRSGDRVMPQFVIERNMPGVGKASAADSQGRVADLVQRAARSRARIQWVHSYVTDDKLYCVYRAPNAEIIREHAKRGGFPADKVSQVHTVIDPTTAE